MKMKIALVYDLIYPFSIGGAEFRNFSLARELVLKGHEVHLFGAKMWKGQDDLKISKNFYAHGVSRYSGKYTFKGKRNPLEPLKYSFFLFFKLMKYEFDIIDVSAFPYFTVFSSKLYCLIKRKPLVITWHEVWDSYCKSFGIQGLFVRIAEKICANLSKNNICVSERTAKNLKRIGQNNKRVIENWIELSEINKAAALNVKYDLISVGRHLRTKNFDLVLKTIAILKKDFPKIKAAIIGDGPDTINLLRIRSALGLEHNVDILGFTREKEQMYSYLKSSRIFFLPSELEGFSITSFEAMACGLPVIALESDMNALADYIKEGFNGYMCKKSEIEFALKIKEMLKNRNHLKKLSRNAKKIAENYDSGVKVKEIEEYYDKIVK
jgi:glycosyltransferase involved in cell wall biosynthesis